MKYTLTLVTLLISAFTIQAQDPNIIWQRTIGGSGFDSLYTLNKTNDGGIILGAHSNSGISGDKTDDRIGHMDFWIIKLDNNQNIEWQKTIGGFGDDRSYSISQTMDNGFIVEGLSTSGISGNKTEPRLGFMDYWVVKLDATGNIEWDRTIGGGNEDNTDYEALESIIQTTDGGYMLAGFSDNNISGNKTENSKGGVDYWVVKLSPTGIIEWQKTIGGSGYDVARDIAQTNDGGFILIGTSSSNMSGDKTEDTRGSSADIWVIKLTATYNIEWQKTIGGAGNDEGYRIEQTTDGGYILGAHSDSDISYEKSENSFGRYDLWVIKTDTMGNIEWQRTLGGAGLDQLRSLTQTNDGGYLVGGFSDSDISGNKTQQSKGIEDYWIVKLNNVGIIEWQNTIGGSNFDVLYSLFQADDGSFILGGSSGSDISGDKTENSNGGLDIWIMKHAQTLSLQENSFAKAITAHPNPAKNTLHLNTQDQIITQVNIYTLTGSRLLQLDMNTISPSVDVSHLASGVYFVQLYSGKNVVLKKFVKE